jgi:predicted RNA-binding Zn ribbon-like protein
MIAAKSPTRGAGRVLRCASDALCLDFANTVAWRRSDTPEERLPSPSALLAWCVATGILAAGPAAEIGRRWAKLPREAASLHGTAIELREAIYRLFRATIRREPLPADAMRILNGRLSAAPPRVRIARSGDAAGWWAGSTRTEPADLLAPIAWSAADLMTSPRVRRVRQCADAKGCGWLFLDESRAGTRRWCSMGECGNRAKARRHYLRRKGLQAGAADATGGAGAPAQKEASR